MTKLDKEYTLIYNPTNRLTSTPTNGYPTNVTNKKDTTNIPTNPKLFRSEIVQSNNLETVQLEIVELKIGTDQNKNPTKQDFYTELVKSDLI